VVVRTASDAYEFAVGSDGDIVKAITQGTPVITPLPGEENGQAISYSADGTQFLTLSSVAKPVLRSYKPFVPPPPTVAQEKAGSAGGGSSISFSDITNIFAALGVLGFLTTVAGFLGIYLHRRRYRQGGGRDDYGDEYGDEGPPRRRPARERVGQRSGRGGRGDAVRRRRGDDYDYGEDEGHWDNEWDEGGSRDEGGRRHDAYGTTGLRHDGRGGHGHDGWHDGRPHRRGHGGPPPPGRTIGERGRSRGGTTYGRGGGRAEVPTALRPVRGLVPGTAGRALRRTTAAATTSPSASPASPATPTGEPAAATAPVHWWSGLRTAAAR
jgi:hypothetical protein